MSPRSKKTETTTPADRVRERIAEWMETTGISQREFAERVKRTQPWLQAILKGQNQVRLEDLDMIAHAMGTTACELVRTSHERYALEVSPSELRVVQRMRHRTEVAEAVKSLLDMSQNRK